jgi:hypothetical protein
VQFNPKYLLLGLICKFAFTMKHTLKPAILLFLLVTQFCPAFAQNFDHFEPLMPNGPIPANILMSGR